MTKSITKPIDVGTYMEAKSAFRWYKQKGIAELKRVFPEYVEFAVQRLDKTVREVDEELLSMLEPAEQ